jgi:hypothetical protein
MNMSYLRMANKYIEHNNDESFIKEFEYCYGVKNARL